MKKTPQIILVLLILTFWSCQNDSLNGKVLTGFENDIYFDGPNEDFQTILTFKNDSVLVERNSISITDKNKSHFKKLGLTYRYKGLVKKDGAKINFVAVAYKCSDCPELAEVGENGKINDVLDQKVYKGQMTKNGAKFNGIDFKEN